MMKRITALVLALCLFAAAAFAEGVTWTCIYDGTENGGKYCGECGLARAEAASWTCPDCGHEDLSSAFCPDCGKKRPDPVLPRGTGTYEGPGFASPKEAAAAYAEAFNRGDVREMLSTFAIEALVDHTDARAYVERLGAAHPSSIGTIPVAGPYSRNLEIEKRRGEILNSLWNSYLLYSTAESDDFSCLGEMSPLLIADGKTYTVDDYIEWMKNSPVETWIGNMEIIGVYTPDEEPLASEDIVAEHYFSEQNQKIINKQIAPCGADESCDAVVLINIGGAPYLQFMQCIRYGEVWYNYTVQSNLANLAGLNVYAAGFVPADGSL